jgi:2'-5' RNA ligase
MSKPSETTPGTRPLGYSVELYFDSATENILLALRAELVKHGIRPVLDEIQDRPHISLAVFPALDPDAFVRHLRAFSAVTTAFPVTLGAVGSFPTADGILFLAPAVSPPLVETHANFHAIIAGLNLNPWEYYLPNNWVPHCTIALDMEADVLAKAFREARRAFRATTGRIEEIGLVCFRPVQNLHTFPLHPG